MSHLLFVDDSFFFFNSNAQEAGAVKFMFKQYELDSGQAVNFQKSGIFFSSNVKIECRQHLSNILEVHSPLNHGRYLGLALLNWM